ncbi:DUF1145 domain-containing protein [Pseudomonas sp. RL_15y_Pfl2_60]|uniref:DUF1145 domain-containing protein n=1 Tax=Pseudomonas sp. RL_15y_Pfl2_60 TaxID=3088709 RepID=UPI0030DC0985
MKVILAVGAVLTLLFWAAVVGNLLEPYAQPFSLLLNIAGALVAAAHIVELWYFRSQLQQSPSPWVSRAKVLVLGVFHTFTLKRDNSVSLTSVHAHLDATSAEQSADKAEPEGDSHLQLQMQFESMAETKHEHA